MKELKRKFFDELLSWKATKGRECLLVKGARQIGKTFIIRKFGNEAYERFVEINFSEEPQFISVFAGNLDADTIYTGMSAIRRDLDIIPGKTLRYYKNGAVEMEFMLETESGIAAVEVKAQTGRTRSLDTLLRRDSVSVGYKFAGGNVGASGKKVTLPHYMVMFLRRSAAPMMLDAKAN